MEPTPPQRDRTAALARTAGISGVAFVVFAFLPGNLGGIPSGDLSAARLLAWVHANRSSLSLQGFLGALQITVVAAFLLLLLARAGAGGPTGRIATAAVTA